MFIFQQIKYPLVSYLIFFSIWQVLAAGYIPPPTSIFLSLFYLLQDYLFYLDIFYSIYRLIVGWLLGTVVGIFLGVLIGYYKVLYDYVIPIFSFMFPIPKIALLPLILVVFGLGDFSKIFVIAMGAFYPTVVTSYSAIQKIPKELIEVGRSLGGNSYFVIRKIVIPYSLPVIFNGFRTSASLSFVLLVASEMLASQHGLGKFIFETGSNLDFDKMLAAVFILGILGFIINKLVDLLINKVCYWSIISEGTK